MAGFDVRVRENVPMEARDGTVLRADVYSPASGGGYPVLLQRTPYDKASKSNAATARDPRHPRVRRRGPGHTRPLRLGGRLHMAVPGLDSQGHVLMTGL